MSKAGAPDGNQNARKGKLWTQAIERALKKRSKAGMIEALDELAEKLLMECDDRNMVALKELGDRLEGKAAQSIEVDLPPDSELAEYSDIAAARYIAFALDRALKKKESDSPEPEERALH